MIKVHEESSSSVATPVQGVRIFLENNSLKYKKSNGTVETLSTGLTLEEAQDLLAGSFQDSSSITWTYDDANNVFIAEIEASLLAAFGNLHAVATSGDYNDLVNKPTSNAAVFLDRFYNQNNNEQVSTSSNNVNRFNVTYGLAHTALYKITVDYFFSYNANNTDIIVELLVNGNVVRRHVEEPKDSGGTDGGAGTNQRLPSTFTYMLSATAGNNTIQMRFRSGSNGVESTIRDHVLTVERFL